MRKHMLSTDYVGISPNQAAEACEILKPVFPVYNEEFFNGLKTKMTNGKKIVGGSRMVDTETKIHITYNRQDEILKISFDVCDEKKYYQDKVEKALKLLGPAEKKNNPIKPLF